MNPRRLVVLGTAWGCLVLSGLIAQAGEVSIEDLIGNLKSSDESVRLQAIDELGASGEEAAEAVTPLVQLLKDDSAKVRAHAAWSLGEIGAPAKSAAAALVELLKDPDEAVRRQAVKAIRAIRPGPQVMGPLLVRLLEDADPGVRIRILHAIAEAGAKAVPGLIKALDNDRICYWACLVLREIGPDAKDAVPALTKRLQDPRPEIRREAILALAAMGDAAASTVGPIAAALNDEHTRTAATYALGRIGQIPADAEAAVRANVKSDDKVLGTASLWALARVHPEDTQLRREAGEQLIERLKDQDPLVRVAAARALAALPPAPEIMMPLWEKTFQNADEGTVPFALDAMAALGPAAVPRLTDALKFERARVPVARILGRIGPAAAPATAALAKLVADKDERIANEAILALANIGPGAKSAVPVLAQALQKDENPNVYAVVYALGQIGPDAAEVEPALSDRLASSDPHLALASAWALVRIRPASAEVAAKTLPVLMVGLTSDVPLARRGAAEALGSLGPLAKEAVSALELAVDDEDEAVGAAAAKALSSIRGSAEK
jgi:HEAT repeat protein